MVYHGLSWFIMVYHGLSWFIMVYHGLSWFIVVYRGLSWFIMVYHGLSWFIMVYHGLSWFIMVCHGLSWFVMVYHGLSWFIINVPFKIAIWVGNFPIFGHSQLTSSNPSEGENNAVACAAEARNVLHGLYYKFGLTRLAAGRSVAKITIP